MPEPRPFALSIAGFDPTAGAGVLADIKTFEQCRVCGFGVASAITSQTETEFLGVEWISPDAQLAQLRPLLGRYEIRAVKIGLAQSPTALLQILRELRAYSSSMPVVWDPILRSSSGYHFHAEVDKSVLNQILGQVTVCTPNLEEVLQLAPADDAQASAALLGRSCSVVLKGGHSSGREASDILFEHGQKVIVSSPRLSGPGKHGSGCVFSAALCSGLARGASLKEAFHLAHDYCQRFLKSGTGLLGYHTP